MLEIQITCPLGSRCEGIKDNVPFRCSWYVRLVGKDPQSTKEVDEWRCAIAWLPLMQVEIAQTNRASADAVLSMRDETVKRQDLFNGLVSEGIKRKALRQ
jgi:hypothetical protein